MADHVDNDVVALSPVSGPAMSLSSELSSSTSKAASDTTADTSVAGDEESLTLAQHDDYNPPTNSNANAASNEDAAATADKTQVKEKENATKPADTIEVLAQRPGYRKELRTSPAGKKYLIETQGLWTTLRSLTPVMKKRSLRERLTKRLLDFATFWPFLLRFAKEVINLGKWRFLLHLVASTLTGLTPVSKASHALLYTLRLTEDATFHYLQALRIYLSGRLIAMAQEASEKRTV